MTSRLDERKQVSKQPDPGPLLVTLSIAGIKVTGILVSTGCTENIISLSTLQEMGLKTDFLRECHGRVLVGILGDRLRIVGEMEVPVEMGEYPCQVTVLTTFKIVDNTLLYNAIMGTPLLCASKAEVWVSERRLEFPTPHGTGVVRADQPKPKREN